MRMRAAVAGLLLVVALTGCGAKDGKTDQSPQSVVEATGSAESDPAADAAQAALGVAGAAPSASASKSAAPPAVKAPTQTFAVGVSQFTFTRAGRTLRTLVFYPATGAAGGSPR